MSWWEVFKVQIVTPTTRISQRKEPVEESERNCCMEAAEAWVKTYNKIDAPRFGGPDKKGWPEHYTVKLLMEKYEGDWAMKGYEDFCRDFRAVLEGSRAWGEDAPHVQKFINARIVWEECEK